MSHRRRRRSETAFLCMNRALAIGCLSLRICSSYSLFVLYHRSITAFAEYTRALPPLNTLALRCLDSRRSFGFTFVATCILALLSDFVNQFRYCQLLHSSWFKLIAAHAIAMQDFHLRVSRFLGTRMLFLFLSYFEHEMCVLINFHICPIMRKTFQSGLSGLLKTTFSSL